MVLNILPIIAHRIYGSALCLYQRRTLTCNLWLFEKCINISRTVKYKFYFKNGKILPLRLQQKNFKKIGWL